MKKTVEKLMALQELQFGKAVPGVEARMAQLRLSLPADLLAKYDRLASHGRKPVAVVRNGVCGHCHIHVAVGALFDLSHGAGSCACATCGRFLYLPEAEPVAAPELSPARKVRVRRTRAAAV